MAITWRNMGQSNNSGNSLIAGASDTIASGLKTIQSAAQSVTDEQIRQYDNQADINTAGILSDIGRLDQDGIDSFDINSLNKQFGSQYDPTQIANALDSRVTDLQNAAQQTLQNERAGQRLDSQLATDSLNRQNLTGQMAAKEEAKRKEKAFNDFSLDVNSKIGDYSNQDDIKRRVTKAGQKAKMSQPEIAQAIARVTDTFNNTIELDSNQKQFVSQRQAAQQLQVEQSVANQYNKIDNAARTNGIIPELARLGTTPDTKENSIEALSKQYDPLINGAGFGELDSVTSFQSELANKFNEAKLSAPNNAEIEHFLRLAFDSGTYGTDDGLDTGLIKGELANYIKMKQNKEGIRTYLNARKEVDSGARESLSRYAKDIQSTIETMRNNNKVNFTGEGIKFDIPASGDLRGDKLKKSNWFQ